MFTDRYYTIIGGQRLTENLVARGRFHIGNVKYGIILRMKRHLAALLALAAAFSARASWYWPFGSDDKSAKPRISELIEPASLLIDSAADLAMDELLRIEVENPVPRR